MKKFKIKASNRKEAYDVQQAMFKLGCAWAGGEAHTVQYPEALTFFVYDNGMILHNYSDFDYFDRHDNPEVSLENLQSMFAEKASVQEVLQPIKSDGGSSNYYKLTITNKAGESIQCELGDIIRVVVGNDADLFNIIKACRRAYEASQGRGKDGVSIKYDMNKVTYFANEFAHWHKQC